ncbi:hypothetical protein DFH11DRAFT_359912 [Phellopilus nigrolimitatus]|nr:hypothetical protein DFH11DRAFT_359912 [Phellopilus nigrolimitatus]
MSGPSVGLFAPLPAQDGKAPAVADFLHIGHSLLQAEPLTLQWYALQYTEDAYKETPTFAIFDTFAGEEGRAAHMGGKIAEALIAGAPSLVAGSPQINKADILASKVEKADVKVGLRVLAEAKADKVEDVRNFLISALPLVEEETLTPQWYAVKLEGVNVFGILDFSEGEEGRQAHLNGKVAAALFAKAEEFFVRTPEVVKVDVIASRVL